MTRLISLQDWNKQVGESVHDWLNNEPRPNGIACVKCGNELSDTTPNMVCASLPPQKNVHCPKCGWHSFRLA